MARRNTTRGLDSGTTQQVISTAVGAVEVLTVGVVHLAERTLVEAVHVAEDVSNELGSTIVRAARGSIKAASDIGGDIAQLSRNVSRSLVRRSDRGRPARKPLAKAGGQKRRRRAKTA